MTERTVPTVIPGGDIVAVQLIAALGMNKSFYLPPRFALLETANNAGQAMTLPGIGERIRVFAENIKCTLADTPIRV